MAKLRVGLLFGGRSVEHEVSLASATSILKALDPGRYDVRLIGIDPEGRWHLGAGALPATATIGGPEVHLPVSPGEHTLIPTARGEGGAADLDVIFPIVHGRGGEDGSLQGLLELAGVAYVGSGVLGSAVQMDKDVAKRLMHAAGIPVVPWTTVRARDLRRDAKAAAAVALREVGVPAFTKPANLGSSVGISHVVTAAELVPALEEAARYDDKILVERALDARELEVAILGNDPVEASVPGEIRTRRDFYDYEAKYVDEDTELLVPAPIPDALADRLRALAIEAFAAVEGSGLARVDFLVDRNSLAPYVNEVNSLPGFTDVSMFPRLWEASGLPYPALLDRLIELALDRHRAHAKLETTYRR